MTDLFSGPSLFENVFFQKGDNLTNTNLLSENLGFRPWDCSHWIRPEILAIWSYLCVRNSDLDPDFGTPVPPKGLTVRSNFAGCIYMYIYIYIYIDGTSQNYPNPSTLDPPPPHRFHRLSIYEPYTQLTRIIVPAIIVVPRTLRGPWGRITCSMGSMGPKQTSGERAAGGRRRTAGGERRADGRNTGTIILAKGVINFITRFTISSYMGAGGSNIVQNNRGEFTKMLPTKQTQL